MLYFLTSHNNPELKQKDGQESNQTFSRINLIATTPKGFAILVLGGLAISLLTFMLGFVSGKWAAASGTKSNLENASISNMPHQFPPAPPNTPIPYNSRVVIGTGEPLPNEKPVESPNQIAPQPEAPALESSKHE